MVVYRVCSLRRVILVLWVFFFFFKQKTAYEMRISDWSSDVCSSDLLPGLTRDRHYGEGRLGGRPYIVVDTGGFEPVAKDGILLEMARQTEQEIGRASCRERVCQYV